MVKFNKNEVMPFKVRRIRKYNDAYIMKHPECCGVMILADLFNIHGGKYTKRSLTERLKEAEKQANSNTGKRSIIQLFLSQYQNDSYERILLDNGYTCFTSFINRNTRSMNYGYLKDLTKVKKAKTKRIFA